MEALVTSVTVYRNGALVVRRGDAEPGVVRVDGLPLLYASDSLRVRPAAGEVRGLRETMLVSGGAAANPHADETRRLDLETEAIEAARERLDARLKAYAGLRAAPTRSRRLPPAEALLEVHGFATERLAALESERAALDDRARAVKAGRRALKRAGDTDRVPPRFTRGLRFELVGEATAVEVEYFVEAARWVPTYALELEGGQATLRMEALVAHASGEDWSGVEVTVSTADLAREAVLPELQSWRIGTAQPRRTPRFRSLPEGTEALFAGYDAAGPPPSVTPTHVGHAALEREVEAHTRRTAKSARVAESARMMLRGEDVAVAGPPAPPVMPSAAPMMPGAAPTSAMAFDDASTLTGGGMSLDEAVALSAPQMARRSRGGGGPPTQSMGGTVRPPSSALTTRLRYAYLRVAGPDEPHRGQLRPVDALTHLWSLVEDHETAGHADLQRAVSALSAARRRMEQRPTPPGTRVPDAWHQLYRADGAHDLPGDGGWHRVPVLAQTAPAVVEYRTVPRESHDVFRFCRVRAPERLPLPSGPMQVYIGGAFKVTATLPASGGGKPLELNLGLEPAVRVVERKAHAHQEDKGLMSHTTRVDHSVVVRVRSGLPDAATLHVYDRLPVPADDEKDLKVTLLESTPAAQQTDLSPAGEELEGGLRWTLEMAPGAVSNLAWQYRVELPAKQEVVGGNRRE